MKSKVFGHRFGDKVLPTQIMNEIIDAIEKCEVKIQKGSGDSLKKDVMASLSKKGWPPEVVIDPSSKISITSLKNKTGLCFQTGNMGRVYADLIKLQTVYLRQVINVGIIIVPLKKEAKKIGDNIVNYERLTSELLIFDRAITVPLFVIGLG